MSNKKYQCPFQGMCVTYGGSTLWGRYHLSQVKNITRKYDIWILLFTRPGHISNSWFCPLTIHGPIYVTLLYRKAFYIIGKAKDYRRFDFILFFIVNHSKLSRVKLGEAGTRLYIQIYFM